MSEPSEESLEQLHTRLGRALEALEGSASSDEVPVSGGGAARTLRDIVQATTRLDELLPALAHEVQSLIRRGAGADDAAARLAADELLAIAEQYRAVIETGGKSAE